MSDKDIQEFEEKLNYGLDLAERRMLEEKALRGRTSWYATKTAPYIIYLPRRLSRCCELHIADLFR